VDVERWRDFLAIQPGERRHVLKFRDAHACCNN